jgi:phosphoribosyl 1,2-cyclic phosphate phosphodiesterase
MRITVLGCGNSMGVPSIGCDCAVCLSPNPKNKRSRVSVLVEEEGSNLLIDTSPDLREQALKNGLRRVDAVLYTHDHADHTMGIDDIRAFNLAAGSALPAFGSRDTMDSLAARFPYIFRPRMEKIFYGAALTPNPLGSSPVGEVLIKDISITYFEQIHGKITSLGYRIGKFAYSTDLNALPESAFDALRGVEVWLVDCLRYSPSFSHSYLDQTLEWIARVQPALAILTHMGHDLEYDRLSNELPSGVVAGYDGMVINI